VYDEAGSARFDLKKELCHTARGIILAVFSMTRRRGTVACVCVPWVYASFLLCWLLATTAWAQRGGILDDTGARLDSPTLYQTAPGTSVLIFTVFSENTKAHLDRQALLRLVSHTNQTATWQTTEDTSQAVFTNIPFGSYAVEVSAVGYLSALKEVPVMNSLRPALIGIVLQRDPSAINLDLADRLLSAKARKETKRAVSALKSGNFKNAQKELDDAYKSAPSSADLNFLLGYLYFQKKDFEKATNYLGTATRLNPGDAQSLTLLGRAGLERLDYVAARSALERAVAVDVENWLPHNLLADSYLRQKNYGKARDEAQVAIAKGKTEASPAQLVLGQALVGLGLDQQGIQALDIFLQESPHHPMAGQVRSLITEIREHESTSPSGEAVEKTEEQLTGLDPLQALRAPLLSVKSWQPPGIDESKVAVATGVGCPSERIVEETGKHVQELVDDVTRFAAVEDLFHQSLDEFGNPIRTETRKYNYVAAISEPEPGSLAVDEYRADKFDLKGYPDQIASTGFAALALVFHPHMRDNFEMSCEGLGDWHGQATWIVLFRQRRDKPSRMHSYKVGNLVYPVDLRGRAWITADKFQIVRIESELVRPMPEIKLLSEHQVVDYGPIRFEKKNTSLWLPKSADIYFDFRRHRYYRRHSFDHYMLFSTDTEEKRKEPKAEAPDGKREPVPN
jgi:tetratricopeptide (TPR) repeat protein